MDTLKWIAANLDDIIIVVAAIIGVIARLKQGKRAELRAGLFAFVTEVEQDYGPGMGLVKFSRAAEWVYERIPSPLSMFFTAKDIEKLIEDTLTTAKEKWQKSDSLQEFINDKPRVIEIEEADAEHVSRKTDVTPL